MPDFDAIIIGTGQAGPSLAFRLATNGQKVAIIERDKVGGTCVNVGCTPTKTLVASAYAAHMARRAAEYGITIGGPVGVNMKAVKARKDKIVTHNSDGLKASLQGAKNITLIEGHARLVSPREVSVGSQLLRSEQIFLNVGGRSSAPPMPGLDQVPYLTSETILDLDQVPQHLVVIGGSYIGLEFGQMYRRFGAAVTIVEMGPRLIGREDEDVSNTIADILEGEGIRLRLDAKCIALARDGKGVSVQVDCTDGAPKVQGSHVLLAVGRRPNTDDLGLDKAGVITDERGNITVDEQLRTNVPGIWALGDCNGRGAFTHTAYNDYEIVAANLLDRDPRRVSDRITNYGLFIDPPLGRVGMTEAQARKTGKRILVGQRPMTRVNRAVEKGEALGLMKIIVDADSEEILGAAILGPGGDEAVHGVLDLMYAKAPYSVLQRAVHIHPTVSELIPTLLGELQPPRAT